MDNTKDILRRLRDEGLPIDMREDALVTFRQAHELTSVLREAAERWNPEWILPLDCDEFLTGEGASAEAALAELPRDRVTLLPWKTYVPTPEDPPYEHSALRRITHRRTFEPVPYFKILVPGGIAGQSNIRIPTGSHALHGAVREADMPSAATDSLSLAHFPVRSSDQLMVKILSGWLTLSMDAGRQPGEGKHWERLFERCGTGEPFGAEELRETALRYAAEPDMPDPALVRDPIPTTAVAVRYPPKTLRPWPHLAETAKSLAEEAARLRRGERSAARGMRSVRELAECLAGATAELRDEGLRAEFQKERPMPPFQQLDPATARTRSAVLAEQMAHILLAARIRAGTRSENGRLPGSRREAAALLPRLPGAYADAAAILAAPKLPLAAETPLRRMMDVLRATSMEVLRQDCWSHEGRSDVFGACARRMGLMLRGAESSLDLPASVAHGAAVMTDDLLRTTMGMANGLADSSAAILSVGPGTALPRAGAQLLLERHPRTPATATHIARRFRRADPEAISGGLWQLRMMLLLQEYGVDPPASEPVHDAALDIAAFAGDPSALMPENGTPVMLCTAMDDRIPSAVPEDSPAETLMRAYAEDLEREGLDASAVRTQSLARLAAVHAMLRGAEEMLATVVIPRTLLRSPAMVALRRLLAEDCDAIIATDLGESGLDPLDPAAAFAVLCLVRKRGISQRTEYVGLDGDAHARERQLMGSGTGGMQRKRIAPEHPYYLFAPGPKRKGWFGKWKN